MYFDNAVYFLPPVTELQAEKFLALLINEEHIGQTTGKYYQLRKVDDVYEVRNGVYRTNEQRYLSSEELEGWLSWYRGNYEAQNLHQESICTIQEQIFDGIATARKWVANPINGFNDVAESESCPSYRTHTPTPQSPIGTTRDNPVQPGLSTDTFDGLSLAVSGFDSDAWPVIRSFSSYADPPMTGNKFVMVSIRVQVVDGLYDSAMTINKYDFGLLGSSAVLFDAYGSCITYPNQIDASMFQGAVYEGNLCFEIPIDEKDLLIRYKGDTYDDGVAWLRVAQPSAIVGLQNVSSTLVKDPSRQEGAWRSHPIPFGATWLTPNGLDIVIESANTDAWDVVLAENMFNDHPESGNRHLMITVNIKNDLGGATPLDVSKFDFQIVGSTGLYRGVGSWRCGVIPDTLDATLYQGGSTRGNICFEVGEHETGFILSYEQSSWASIGSLGDN